MSNFTVIEEWAVDPTFIACRRTFITVLLQRIYPRRHNGLIELFYFGRPVTRLEVVGTVVSIVRFTRRHTVCLDDGTGCIPCVQFVSPTGVPSGRPFDDLRIGDLASVRGELIYLESNEHPYGPHLHIKYLDVLRDPNLELLHWTSALQLHESVYCQPYRRPAGLPAPVASSAVAVYDPRRRPEACACVRTSLLPVPFILSSFCSSAAAMSAPSSSSSTFSSSAASSGSSPPPPLVALQRALQHDPLYPVRKSLLYCPCRATPAPLDPTLSFRWKLLRRLGWRPDPMGGCQPGAPESQLELQSSQPVTFRHHDLTAPGVLAIARAHARVEATRREEAVIGVQSWTAKSRGRGSSSSRTGGPERHDKRPKAPSPELDGEDGTRENFENASQEQQDETPPAPMDSPADAATSASDFPDHALELVETTTVALLADGVLLRKGDDYLLVSVAFLIPTLRWYLDNALVDDAGLELEKAFPAIPAWRWGLCRALLPPKPACGDN